MNPVNVALRRPITTLVIVLGMAATGILGALRMKADIFPALNLPVVYVCQPYGGMDPQQMEGLIANFYEYHFLYINGIHHVESKNIQGVSLMKLFFHPGTDMAQGMAETVGYVNRSRAFMPPGTVPPFIMRFDTGSVPVGSLVLSSETKTLGEIQDQALFKVRPMFAAIPGVSAPPPFGGNQRTIVVRADPDRLRSYNLSPDDLVKALASGNAISPSGSIRTPTLMPLVPSNAMVSDPKDLGNISVRKGVYLRDVAPLIEDASDIATGFALVNGRRAVYILVTKRADASTLEVVKGVREAIPAMQDSLPPDIAVSFEMDQSPWVQRALDGLVGEGILAAILVGLMVLLFLRDWRSVAVVVLNIPLALMIAVACLWLLGQSINLMTLGGLSLAVGILVDEATVELENIHTQKRSSKSVAEAVVRGNRETAVPRLLALLCIMAAFAPALFLQGAARGLFVPLALAVIFSMLASYLLSSTLVPVLAVWLLRERTASPLTNSQGPTLLTKTWADAVVRNRWTFLAGYLVLVGILLGFLGPRVGMDLFPAVDAGIFQFRLRGPDGTRIEETEALTREALDFINKEAGEGGIALSIGYLGVVPPSYPINSVYQWMSGPEESVMRVALAPGPKRLSLLKQSLREKLPNHLKLWLKNRWIAKGESAAMVDTLVDKLRLSFEPADIVSETMSFGSPTPVEVVVSGSKMADNMAFAAKVREALATLDNLKDIQYGQSLEYPTVAVKIDRERAAQSGVTSDQVAKSLVAATSSSRFTLPNFWRDPASGIGYQVQVEIPQVLMKSSGDIEAVPVKADEVSPVLLRDVAEVKASTMPGQIDRYNMRRLVSITANVEGADLGTISAQIDSVLKQVGQPPPGVKVEVLGQIPPLKELLSGLGFGFLLTLVAIILLLTAFFQSLRMAFVCLASVPATVSGVFLALVLTGSTLNLQSFMGAIMALGVAMANAILLVSFAKSCWGGGKTGTIAAAEALQRRVRPVLMTSLAMTAGMFPMALGLGEGGDQTAPLARAVIGGLLASTMATIFLLPGVFALLTYKMDSKSQSLDPEDPESSYYLGGNPKNPTIATSGGGRS
ncbi:MAG: efflux RND transporter permease subunit [Gemmataceae bacterium]|nr:efflux RND transporter permease subunit [Gemmataceae bacterium]